MTPGEAIDAFILSLLGASPNQVEIELAQDRVREYLNDKNIGTSWTNLDKKAWCDRVIELLGAPQLFNQGHTNFCLASACLMVLFKRKPLDMADFCIALASTGTGKIYHLKIKMTQDIQSCDIPAAAGKLPVNPTDFILILAIQEAMGSIFSSAIKKPEDASPAIKASNIKDILEETGYFTIKEINSDSPTLTNQTEDTDMILVGWLKFFKTAPATVRHAVVLAQPMKKDGDRLLFRYWSWGMVETDLVPGIEPHHDEHNVIDYYEQKCSPSDFSTNIDTVYVVTSK
jgi:hypothetical protein